MTRPLAGVFGVKREHTGSGGPTGPKELTVLTCDGCEYLREFSDDARCHCPDVVKRSGGKMAYMSLGDVIGEHPPVWFVPLEVLRTKQIGTLRIIRPSPICPFAARRGECKLSETV